MKFLCIKSALVFYSIYLSLTFCIREQIGFAVICEHIEHLT